MAGKRKPGFMNLLFVERFGLKFTFLALLVIVLIFLSFPEIFYLSESHLNAYNSLSGGETIDLPEPDKLGINTLEKTIEDRRSVRHFKSANLSLEEISQLLWAGQGITEKESGLRSSPSAGATYPLELYVVDAEGVYNYEPEGHVLHLVKSGDLREDLVVSSLGQSFLGEAPVVIVITGVYDRTTSVYGEEVGKRYVYIEVGHCAQNILLQSVALGLDSVPVGAFSQSGVQEALSLADDHKPLYLIPVG